MRPRKRDPAFLFMAAVAASGGCIAIVASIGLPIWASQHGRPYTPAFALFSAWGLAALAGAYASLHTYLLTDEPPRPPRGGVRLEFRKRAEAVPPAASAQIPSERRVA